MSSSNDEAIEVNREHVLNYESDDSDDDNNDIDSDESIGKKLKKQKEELTMNDAWGSSKRGFYGRDKKRDDESSSDGDDEDEYQEALRL
jgi:hypothetical protein